MARDTERFKLYMREYMRRRRQSKPARVSTSSPICSPAPAVSAPAVPEPEPAVKVDPVPASAEVTREELADRSTSRIEDMLARGRATVAPTDLLPESVPADSGPELPYLVPPQGFDGWPQQRQAGWLARNWAKLIKDAGELAQEAVDERLVECRAAVGRRRL